MVRTIGSNSYRTPSPESRRAAPSEAGSAPGPKPLGAFAFQVSHRPASVSRQHQSLQGQLPTTQASLQLLEQHTAANGDGEAFAQYLKQKTTFQDDGDGRSVASDATIRLLQKGRPESSYFESDVDDPTVVADDEGYDDDPDNPFLMAQAKAWVNRIDNARYWTTAHVKQKTAIMTIEKHRGGPISTLVPETYKPQSTDRNTPPGTRLDPMEWNICMTQTLKKVAARCPHRDFLHVLITKMSHKESCIPRSTQIWMTCDEVNYLYDQLQSRGVKPRRMNEVWRAGPNVNGPSSFGPHGLYMPQTPLLPRK